MKARYPIAADDSRHGTNAGYVAGCRCEGCSAGRLRYQKTHQLRLLQGLKTYYSREEVLEIVGPWLRMGISETAIKQAAGLDHGHGFTNAVTSTSYRSLAAVTETDFEEKVTVLSDLTKRRIYSLMAAGHQVKFMPVSTCGVWRKRDRIRIETARDIRSFYAENEMVLGTSRITASRALNAGHVPPLAWDDPGTLAWPSGRPDRIIRGPKVPRGIKADVDAIVVARFLDGDHTIPTTQAERREIVAEWLRLGRSLRQLELVGWKPERYVDRTELEETA